MKLLIFTICTLFVTPLFATESWPVFTKNSYVDRCSQSMQAQGLSVPQARPYCLCLANGMESEFGMSEYEAMMGAQPNPRGSPADRRLYRIMASCGKALEGRM